MRSRQSTTPRRTHPTVAAAVVASCLLAACSAGGGSSQVTRRPASSTTAAAVLGNAVDNGGSGAGAPATRFTLDDGTTVLVPVGAVVPGAEVTVKRTAATAAGAGPTELGPSTYEVAASKGTIAKPVVLQVPLADKATAGVIAVAYDTASRSWLPANGDLANGSLTIYAAGAGTYGLMRWNWTTAATIGAEAVAAVVGGSGLAEGSLSCGDVTSLATRFTTRASGNTDVMRWCGGTVAGADAIGIGNGAATPLTLRTVGLSDASVTRRRPLTDAVVAVARRHWDVPGSEGLELLAPGDRAQFRLTELQPAQAALQPAAFSQYYVTLGAAAAYTVGLFTGSVDGAVALLDRDEVRSALLADLDKAGCADRVASSVSEASAEQLAATVQELVTTCVSRATVAGIVAAASKQSALRAAFAASTTDLPERERTAVAGAVTGIVRALVEAVGANGEVTATPIDPLSTTTVPATLPVTTLVAAPPTTVPPTAPVIATTTTSPGGTTPPGPTTTTAAPAPTTTTIAGPVPPVVLVAPDSCRRNRGTVLVTASGLTAGKSHTFTYTAPNGSVSAVTAITPIGGVATRTFNCNNQRAGSWRVTVTDNANGAVSAPQTFTVR